jgi:hypothetical protein
MALERWLVVGHRIVVSARPHIVLACGIAAAKGSAGSSRTAELNMKTVMFS